MIPRMKICNHSFWIQLKEIQYPVSPFRMMTTKKSRMNIEQCSEVDEEKNCEIISKEEVGLDVPGEACSEVETDQEWETFEEVQ